MDCVKEQATGKPKNNRVVLLAGNKVVEKKPFMWAGLGNVQYNNTTCVFKAEGQTSQISKMHTEYSFIQQWGELVAN